ncbi:hypothetical protein L2E82_37679 [Cichorium intybus]|uniref:Uncharacterized protein n=1 Tax=Cichorium intybus TaxID=13427 RepID=A0ACB9AEC3_CICIN|nr:hypothetical protein L2E82_37679 [Cichorium intybus]
MCETPLLTFVVHGSGARVGACFVEKKKERERMEAARSVRGRAVGDQKTEQGCEFPSSWLCVLGCKRVFNSTLSKPSFASKFTLMVSKSR